MTCFVPDEAKEGGSYRTITGTMQHFIAVNRVLVVGDGLTIARRVVTVWM